MKGGEAVSRSHKKKNPIRGLEETLLKKREGAVNAVKGRGKSVQRSRSLG